MPRVTVEGLDVSPEEHFQRMVQLGEGGYYFNLAREYVDLRYRKTAGTATDAELKTLDYFEDYLTETSFEPSEKGVFVPERSHDFLIGFFSHLDLYRAELVVNSAYVLGSTKDKISKGQVPGTRVYRGSEQAVTELAGNMMSHSPEFMMMQSASFGLDMLVRAFDQEDLTEEMKHRKEVTDVTVKRYVDAAVPDSKIEEKYHLTPQGKEFGIVNGADDLKPLYEKAEKAYNDSAQALDTYDHFRDTTSGIAKLQLVRMQEMAAKKKDNSPEFMGMLTALQDVANLDGSDSPALVQDKLNALRDASKHYTEKIHGSFFGGRSADGKARTELAETLAEFADLQSGTLRNAAEGKLKMDVPLQMQHEDLEITALNVALDPAQDTPLKQATIDEVTKGFATFEQAPQEPMHYVEESFIEQPRQVVTEVYQEPQQGLMGTIYTPQQATISGRMQPIEESVVQKPKRAVMISYNDLESREQAARAESEPAKNKPSKAQIEQAAQKRLEESQPAKGQPVKDQPQGPAKKQ